MLSLDIRQFKKIFNYKGQIVLRLAHRRNKSPLKAFSAYHWNIEDSLLSNVVVFLLHAKEVEDCVTYEIPNS
jgi:hypothetical protein